MIEVCEDEVLLLPPSRQDQQQQQDYLEHNGMNDDDDDLENRSWTSFALDFGTPSSTTNAQDIMDEIEELSQYALDNMATPPSSSSSLQQLQNGNLGNHHDVDDASFSIAETMASLKQDLPVWWRVRQRFRRLFGRRKGNKKATATGAAKTTSTTPATASTADVSPNDFPAPRRDEARQDEDDSLGNGNNSNDDMMLMLQFNHDEEGVEVEWPHTAETLNQVDVSRVREHHSSPTTIEQQEERQPSEDHDTVDLSNVNNSSFGSDTEHQDTTLSVTVDPKDKCVQLVMVRTSSKNSKMMMTPPPPSSTQHKRDESGLTSWGEDEEASSLLLNDLTLGVTFPFSPDHQQVNTLQAKTSGNANKHNATSPASASKPTYIDSTVEHPSRPLTDWPFPYHGQNVAATTLQKDTEPHSPDDYQCGSAIPTDGHEANKQAEKSSSPPLRPPSMVAGSDADSKAAVVSLLSSIPMQESFSCEPHHHPIRVKSSDSLWSDLEEQNRAPFDEPVHQEESMRSAEERPIHYEASENPQQQQQQQQQESTNFLGIMDDRWFKDMLHFSQQDMCAANGETNVICAPNRETASLASIPRSIPMMKDDTLETSVISMPESLSSSYQQQAHKFVSAWSLSKQQPPPPPPPPPAHHIHVQEDTERQSSTIDSLALSSWSFLWEGQDVPPAVKRNEPLQSHSPVIYNTPENNRKDMSVADDTSNPSLIMSEFDPTDIENYVSAAVESSTYEKQDYACYPYGNESTTTAASSTFSNSNRRRRRPRH